MLKIKNTLSGKKESFKPLKKNEVSMYVCGPTVYDKGHLGHGRSAVCFDVVRRYLIYKGYDVKFVSNYTDIDDKMINRAREENVTVSALAERIIPLYREDYEELGVLTPSSCPRATEHINEMVEFVGRMQVAGVTYIIDGDGVYFDISKSFQYGKLSKQKLADLRVGARVAENISKRNPYDFVVWKFVKEGEPSWDSPWGKGRPGWHLECSVMSWKLLGEKFDIHGGGADLVFPHHECEIAQSESVFGAGTFAKYWMHNGFITINEEKMSKSLGNFFTIRDVLTKYSGQVLRFMFLQKHYSSPIEFSNELLEQSKASLQRIHDFVRRLKDATYVGGAVGDAGEEIGVPADGGIGHATSGGKKFGVSSYKKKFEDSMDNDFDTSGALSSVFDLINDFGRGEGFSGVEALKFLEEVDQVLGIVFVTKEEVVSDEVSLLIQERENARKRKDFKLADAIRAQLLEKGIELEDTAKGTIWKKV